MAAIQWPDVVAFAPGVDGVAELAQEGILAYVNTSLSPDAFGGEDAPKLRYARAMLAAHCGELWNRRGQGGAPTGETVGADAISFSYAAPFHGAISALETTSYGLELRRLIDSSARARMPVTR